MLILCNTHRKLAPDRVHSPTIIPGGQKMFREMIHDSLSLWTDLLQQAAGTRAGHLDLK